MQSHQPHKSNKTQVKIAMDNESTKSFAIGNTRNRIRAAWDKKLISHLYYITTSELNTFQEKCQGPVQVENRGR